MTGSYFSFDFYLEDNGADAQGHIDISQPELTKEGDAVCKVTLTPILANEKKIFGSDQLQAKTLAVEFVKSIIRGKSLRDVNGSALLIADSNDLSIFATPSKKIKD